MTLPLTPKQEKLWRFIASCERSPTYDEMAQALGLKCRGGRVVEVVRALERKGFVHRGVGARSIVAMRPNPDLAAISTDDLIVELTRRGDYPRFAQVESLQSLGDRRADARIVA
jgi:hypothetical protein